MSTASKFLRSQSVVDTKVRLATPTIHLANLGKEGSRTLFLTSCDDDGDCCAHGDEVSVQIVVVRCLLSVVGVVGR